MIIKNKSNSCSCPARKILKFSGSKRSQSQVVTAVLLILIVITLAFIVMNFVVPFVKNQLSGSDCFEVAGKLDLGNNPSYTCFNEGLTPSEDYVYVQIHIDDISESIEGFKIELGGASSKSFTIKDNSADSVVTMFTSGDPIELPGDNEERTYKIMKEGHPDYIKVYPILKGGKTCESSDTIERVSLCIS
jgi:flagellin-like protein